MNNTTFKPRHKRRPSAAGSAPKKQFNKPRQPQRSNRGTSSLNPAQLVKKATQTDVKEFRAERQFNDMPIDGRLKETLTQKGFVRPSEIQDKTLESLLEGRNLLGIAQTGTGKTGAFLIPVIHQLLKQKQHSFALVVVPTRELANQVEDEFKSMAKGLGLYSACFIGGTNINKDLNTLRRPTQVIIGTPGRLLDLVNRRALDLSKFKTLILDEFDRMLDMGFINDMKRIINGMHQRQQTMLFSATLDKSQKAIIESILENPVTVKVSTGESSGDNIDQDVVKVENGQDKFDILRNMIDDDSFEKVLLFEETKHKVSRLCDKLNRSGVKADQIHGNKSQNARQNALNAFKQGRVRVLVATDVAARGIDVSDVTHVINYQMPMTMDSYIHRIGRTGRAGKTGKAITFV